MCPCVLFTVDVLHCGEDVLCVEFIFHWELLVQIRAAEIINERERVQQGEERPRKGYIEEREHRGRKGWSGRVPLESFSLLAGLNRRLWVRKTHTLALFFHLLSITCPPTTSSHSSLSVFFTFSTPSSSVQSIPYFIFSTFPSPILGLIWPFSPGHSLTPPPSFSLHVLTPSASFPVSSVELSQNIHLASLPPWIPHCLPLFFFSLHKLIHFSHSCNYLGPLTSPFSPQNLDLLPNRPLHSHFFFLALNMRWPSIIFSKSLLVSFHSVYLSVFHSLPHLSLLCVLLSIPFLQHFLRLICSFGSKHSIRLFPFHTSRLFHPISRSLFLSVPSLSLIPLDLPFYLPLVRKNTPNFSLVFAMVLESTCFYQFINQLKFFTFLSKEFS